MQELIEWMETPSMQKNDGFSIKTKVLSLLEKEYQMYLQAINSGYHDGYSDGQSHDYGKSLNAEKDFRIIYNNESKDETNQKL